MGCRISQYVCREVASETVLTDMTAYRPPYYHRNGASELMGLIYGEYAGRSDEFQPGGVSYECGFVPHGVAYEEVRNL
jgi:homogentisate 1,2-dioxygenase